MDLDYLNEYQYVSVRSQGDRNKINYINNVKITPCTTMLLKDKLDFNYKVEKSGWHPPLSRIIIHIRNNTICRMEQIACCARFSQFILFRLQCIGMITSRLNP